MTIAIVSRLVPENLNSPWSAVYADVYEKWHRQMYTRRQFLAKLSALPVLTLPTRSLAKMVTPILIGLPCTLTGPQSLLGELVKEAAESFVEYYNGTNNAVCRKLKLVIEDDAGDPKQAVVVANRLASWSSPINFVIGHNLSAATLAALPTYTENNMVLFSPVNADGLTLRQSSNIFRVVPTNGIYAACLADALIEDGKKSIAVIHNQTEYGRGFADNITGNLIRRGCIPKLIEATTVGQMDFAALISKFKMMKVDAVVLGLYPTESGMLVSQAYDQEFVAGRRRLFYGHSLLVAKEFLIASGGQGLGTVVASVRGCENFSACKTLQKDEVLTEICALFRRKNVNMGVMHTIIISTFQILTHAIARAASTDSSVVEPLLHSESYPTVRGNMSFNEFGDLRNPLKAVGLYSIGLDGPELLRTY